MQMNVTMGNVAIAPMMLKQRVIKEPMIGTKKIVIVFVKPKNQRTPTGTVFVAVI